MEERSGSDEAVEEEDDDDVFRRDSKAILYLSPQRTLSLQTQSSAGYFLTEQLNEHRRITVVASWPPTSRRSSLMWLFISGFPATTGWF